MSDVSFTRLRRIAAKPPGYILRRFADEARREAQRGVLLAARGGVGPLSISQCTPRSGDAVLASTEQAALALGTWEAGVAALCGEEVLRSMLRAEAELARRRELTIFAAGPTAVGRPPRWHADVHSGQDWPLGFHRRLPVADLGRPTDVKVPWELSRHRHLVTLACAAATGEEWALDELDADVRSWVAENPVGWSVNWTVGMEVALRAVSLICVDALLLQAGRPLPSRPVLVGSLRQHAWFLERNLEVADVNGNHFLANAVGLLWLARYLGDDQRRRSAWATGLAMARRAAAEHVLSDGFDQEGSLRYHALNLELFTLARHAGGAELRALDPVLERMLDALLAVMDATGRVPNVGDDDSGRVLAFSPTPSEQGARVAALAAAVLGVARAVPGTTVAVELDGVMLAGGRPTGAGSVARGIRTFPRAGVVVLGDGDDHIVLDAGPVGFRGRGGHGHLDAMSFEATLSGRLAVRDSGTGSYTRNPELRNALRDAAAHSGILVDGRRYASLGGRDALWSITGDAPPHILETRGLDDGAQRVIATQELPAARGAARHTRALTWSRGALEVMDEIRAPVGSRIEARLQLPAGCRREGQRIVSLHHRYEPELPEDAVLTLEDATGSERYGIVEPATRALVAFHGDGGPQVLRWLIAAI